MQGSNPACHTFHEISWAEIWNTHKDFRNLKNLAKILEMSSRRKWEERAIWDMESSNPRKLNMRWKNISTVWCLHVGNFSPFHCLSKGCCLAKALDWPFPGQTRSLNNPQKSQLTALVFASGLSISHSHNNHGGRAEGTVQQCTDALAYHLHFLKILSFFPRYSVLRSLSRLGLAIGLKKRTQGKHRFLSGRFAQLVNGGLLPLLGRLLRFPAGGW